MYALHYVNGNSLQTEQGSQNNASSDNEPKSKNSLSPSSVTRALDSKTRNTIRTLRNLRNDLKRLYPGELMPSTWMIKCLVVSCDPPLSRCESWDHCVISVMQRLLAKTENAFDIRNSFFELDGTTPLFPNYELFGPQHANRFASLAIQYLKIQLGKDDNKWPARAIP